MTDPQTILTAFGLSEGSILTKMRGGKVNNTWLVEQQSQRFVLQRVHPDFRPGMIEDSAYVLTQLREDCWDVPTLHPTTSGQFSYSQDGLWRLSTFIESDGHLPVLSSELLYDCGVLLARLHQSLGNISRNIPPPIPHYRDTAFHINYLEKVLPSLHGDARNLAQRIIEAFKDQDAGSFPATPQLIHGDPKLNNMLFRGSKPYTYIDWDTVMTASPLVDLGDFARSLTKEHSEIDIKPSVASFCRGYFDTNHLQFEYYEDLFSSAVSAGRVIALENAARYLYDIVDQSFWKWDETKYSSQEQAMLDQALKSWQIFESLDT